MRSSFHSDHLHRAVARRPTYFRWLGQRDRRGVYAYYRAQLQLLLWQRPCPPDGRVVLKCPFIHLESMRAIFELFPGATIVNLTRDLASVVRSLCHKNRLDREAHSDHVDPAVVGADMVESLEVYYRRRAAELAALTPAQRARIVTIPFEAWAGDPVSIMRRVYALIERPFPDALAGAMAAALLQHPRYGVQARYDLGPFGLREAALRERFEPHEEALRACVTVIE